MAQPKKSKAAKKTKKPKGFELRIEFSGLCLFVVSKKQKKVTVLLPDARRHPNIETMYHEDKSEAVPHAGYLRFDLGDALPGIEPAPNNSVGPRNEGLHRFDREEVDLGLPPSTRNVDVDELEFPDLERIDAGLR